MGCCGSTTSNEGTRTARRERKGKANAPPQELRDLNISGPVTPPGAVPAPVRDEQGLWVKHAQEDLDRQMILKALAYAAEYLASRGQDILLVAVGGAVNTVLLQSRNSTHDVDFFSAQLAGQTLHLVREAGLYAIERSSARLGEDWLNNATARMHGVVGSIDELLQIAVQQNDVVFQAPGLTVLAAPWNYAFTKKISRITQGTGRDYDAADAVAYLHQYIVRHGGQPVPVPTVREWGTRYRSLVPDQILHEIDHAYYETYGRHGLLFD